MRDHREPDDAAISSIKAKDIRETARIQYQDAEVGVDRGQRNGTPCSRAEGKRSGRVNFGC